MLDAVLAFLPITVLMVGALITKRIAEMMVLASVLGAVLVYREDFFSGFIDMMYGALSNSSYQFVLIILIGFGGMIRLFQESGALMGFSRIVSGFASGPRKPLLVAWAMAFVMFVDDYLSTLAVSFSMKSITDENRIPREHLAMQTNMMAACLCVLIPFSSWTAFTVGLLSEQGMDFTGYVRAIPYMFYPLAAIILCLLTAAGVVPKVGVLRDSYRRVEGGGDVVPEEKGGSSLVDISTTDAQKESSALNAVLPVVVMVAVVLLCDNDLVHGLVAAVALQFVMYVGRHLMTVGEFVQNFFEGAKSMASLGIIIFFAFMLSAANEKLGFFDYLIGGIGGTVPPELLPVLTFAVVAFATFATAAYWIMQVIAVPVFIPLAAAMGVDPSLVAAAIMSGVTLGCNCCFYADPVFMTSAGTGVSNMSLVRTTAPYAVLLAVLTAAGYVAAGFLTV